MTLSCLGVMGAGTMGSGIAQVAADAGIQVRLFDLSEDQLERSRDRLRAAWEKLAAKGKIGSEDVAEREEHLHATTRLEDLAGCEAIVEAAPEQLELKRALFEQLGRICPSDTLLATNTSSISVTAIAAACTCPGRVVGLHFFNPVPVMELVEVVAGMLTTEETLGRGRELAEQLGKQPITLQDTPGFVVNRVARPFYGEALRLLSEGVAEVPQVDRIMRQAGFKMGPFELMDLIGLDVNYAVTRSVHEATFGEPRFRPHPLQARMVAAGLLGRKTGKGFYEHR